MFKKVVFVGLIATSLTACNPACAPPRQQHAGKDAPSGEENVIFPECDTHIRTSRFLPPIPAGWVASAPNCMTMLQPVKQGKMLTYVFPLVGMDSEGQLTYLIENVLVGSYIYGRIEKSQDQLTAWASISSVDRHNRQTGLIVLRQVPKTAGEKTALAVVVLGSWPNSAQAELSKDLFEYVGKFPYQH